MSERGGGGSVSLGLIAAIGVILSVVAFGFFLGQQKQYARDYADASEYQTANASEFVQQCSQVSGEALALCIAKKLEADREDRQRRYDLRTQQDMSKWVLLTLLVSIFGLAVTGAGIYFVAHTLIEARKATEASVRAAVASEKAVAATIDTGARQSRCYLAITEASVRFGGANNAASIIPSTVSGDGNPQLYITLKIKNFGETPAYAVAWRPAVRYSRYQIGGGRATMFERQSERLPADLFGRDDFGAEIGPEQEITFVAQYGFNPNSVEYQAATMTPGLGGLYLGVVINITRIDAFDQRETRDYGFSTQLNVYTHGVDVRLTATSPEVFRTQEQARAAAETI